MTSAAVPATRRPGLLTQLAYGFGGTAEGIKNNGFDYFLLFFYSGFCLSLLSFTTRLKRQTSGYQAQHY